MQRDGEDEATAVGKVRAEVDRLVRLEKKFFKLTGIDEYLCWVGKVEPYNIPDYYFLSAKDMQRFGVTRISTPDFYPETKTSGFDIDIRYLDLKN
jgi:hypothetical protein